MNAVDMLKDAVSRDASDIFVVVGSPVIYKIQGAFIPSDENRLSPADTTGLIEGLYGMTGERTTQKINDVGDDDFSVSIPGISRFRVNIYKQRGSLSAVVRIIKFELPNPDAIGIPKVVMGLAERKRGLVLVTGTAGSGKSTTLACLIDRINQTQSGHIITLEDPLEYLHRHRKSIVSQREISLDTESYLTALRASLRQAPDVVLLGEMRDHETISVAMTAAETGHLVFSTLHTIGAASTIDRIVDAFPPNQQGQIRIQLSMVLQAVVSQQLIPTKDGKIVPAFEVMLANNAIRNMIREAKSHQIEQVMHTSAGEGMVTMDTNILALFKKGIIARDDALSHSVNTEVMAKRLV